MKNIKNIKFYFQLYKHYLMHNQKSAFQNGQLQNNDKIPKIIHYCWFGGNPETPLMIHCIESWKKFLPEYELQLWNEENFPFDDYPYAAQAFAQKKWAFVSDVARLHALYNFGGIYMDTDVEILQSIDQFLSHGAFSGYESSNLIPTGIMGAKPRHDWIKLLLSWYDGKKFNDDSTANTRIISKITKLHYNISLQGQQFVLPGDVHIYPEEWFCPRESITSNSYCIHHFAGSWKK